MDNHHIIPVTYSGSGSYRTRAAYQYDYGQILSFDGFDLPDAFEVHFYTGGGESVTVIGHDDQVAIPDSLLKIQRTVTAWLFLHDTEDDGETRFVVEIPVRGRSAITDEEPTPVEQSVITQAIAALQTAVTKTEAAQDAAETAQEAAEAAADSLKGATAGAVTLPEGSAATAELSVNEGVFAFNFGIPIGATGPQGPRGIQGDRGEKGETGATPDMSIGTVQTLPAGSQATAQISGTAERPVLSLGIPKGDPGDATIDDTAGAGDTTKVWSADKSAGEVSELKSAIESFDGGTTGQVLRKKSGTDYDVEWASVGQPTDEQTAEAVSAWLDDHPEATTTVQDFSLTNQKLVKGTLGFVIPQMYGAKGDGETDDTVAIQTCINENANVYFPAGTYLINGDIGLTLHSNLTMKLDDNATIQRSTTETLSNRKALISGEEIENLVISGGCIRGDRASQTMGATGSGHGISLKKFCNNIAIENVEICYHTEDGCYIGYGQYYSSNIILRNCDIHHCQRHGVGIIGVHNMTVDNCDIHHIYWLDGVDIESGYPDYGSEDIRILNSKFHDFMSEAYSSHLGIMNHDCSGLVIENVYAEHGVRLGTISVAATAVIKDSIIKKLVYNDRSSGKITCVSGCRITRVELYNLASEIKFYNCIFDNIKFPELSTCISVTKSGSDSGSATPVLKIGFNNCSFYTTDAYSSVSDKLFYASYYPAYSKMFNCDVHIRCEKQDPTCYAIISVIENSTVDYADNVPDAKAFCSSTAMESFIMINCTVDATNLSSSTVNGFIYIGAEKNYVTGNTVLSTAAIGGVYGGNLLRFPDNAIEVTAVGNIAPGYTKLNNTVSKPTIKAANNIFSGDLV